MKKSIFFIYKVSLFLFVLVAMTACSSDDDDESKSVERYDLSVKLSLKNDKGQETNTFKEGENIIFCITVENRNSYASEYDSYALFGLTHYEAEWYNEKAIDVSEMAKNYPSNQERLTAFAVYNADKQVVSFPMDKILKKEFSIASKGSVAFECPWFQKEGETLYSGIFEKGQQRTALPAGQYEVCNLSFISMAKSDWGERMQFTVVK